MNMRKKPGFWIIFVVMVIAGGSAVLYTTGNLPFVSSSSNGVAFADTSDTTAVASTEDKNDDDDKPEVIPVPVELAKVEGRGIEAYYRSASVIEADRLVDLVTKTTGRVQLLNVDEGDWVEKGDILAELENSREKIQLRKAELTMSDKKRLMVRNKGMLDEELISLQDYDDFESAWKLAEAERDLARINLEDTRIRAPFTGRITNRQVVQGQQVAIATATFTLGDFSPMRIRVHLPEEIARKVKDGQRVLVSPEALSEPLEAVVERISPVVDPRTSTVRLTMLLEDENAGARVGGFAKVRITTDAHHDALAIPKTALVEEGALSNVFIAEADTVRKVEVQTGLYDETHVEILEGIFAGDFVVTMGQGGLEAGSVINVLNADGVGYITPESEKSDPAEESETVTALAGK